MSNEVKLDWNQAKVDQGDLLVRFTEQPPNGWTQLLEEATSGPAAFGETQRWGRIRASSEETYLWVSDVQPGYENALHEHLDKIVQHISKVYEANLGREAREGGASDADMQRRFRAA